jgi:hypothetical protein
MFLGYIILQQFCATCNVITRDKTFVFIIIIIIIIIIIWGICLWV